MSIFDRIFRTASSVPLERQLDILAECGIRSKQSDVIPVLLKSSGREEYERDPFRLAAITLGSQREEEPFDWLSDSVWHLDTESIECPGSYVAVAERVRDISQGELPITKVCDEVDIEAGVAWVSFSLEGREFRWDAEVKDDWIDPAILGRFASLLRERGSRRLLTYLDLKGQDCLIGCSTEMELDNLHQLAKLPFTWLK